MARSWLSTRRSACVLALAAGVALAVVPAAQAANIVPNPGFENCTGGVPDQWQAGGGATFTCDTSTFHSGASSALLTNTDPMAFNAAAISDCISVTAGTTYNLLIYYHDNSGSVTQITFAPHFFSNADCTGSQDSSQIGARTNSPLLGAWLPITGTATATTNPFNAQSATLEIGFGCSQGCVVGGTVGYDDAAMDTAPLVVTIDSFQATRAHRGVMLHWRTGTEIDTLGFNVYRQQGTRRVRLNRHLLPALGGLAGSTYSYRDRRAPRHRAVRYWLQDVSTRGIRTWHGPIRVRAA
jgi:Carbohydrate binding domain